MAEQELTAPDWSSGQAALSCDGELGRLPSLIERMVRLASLCDPATGCYRESTTSGALAAEATLEFLRNDHQRAFAAWLRCSPAQQLADLEAHIRETGRDGRLFCSTESYRAIIPSAAAVHEQGLFFCSLEVVLAVLRNRCGGVLSLGGWRVRQMLESLWDSQGSGRLTLKQLGSALGVPDQCLGRSFHQRTGVTFHHYQRLLRIQRGAKLLRDPALPIKEIAASLDYTDRSNFNREFRRALGTTPGQFRGILARAGA
jgi:AraC-like DNA-binding protein